MKINNYLVILANNQMIHVKYTAMSEQGYGQIAPH